MTAPAALNFRKTRLLQTAALIALAVSVSGCAGNKRDVATTGSIPKVSNASLQGMNTTELSSTERSIGAAYTRDPKNKAVGLQYATVLGMTGKNAQALAVMQQVAIAHPADRDVLAAYGKAQAAAGQLEQALSTISRAQTPDQPDWRLYSAEGAVLDQLGRSDEARKKYRMALDWCTHTPSAPALIEVARAHRG